VSLKPPSSILAEPWKESDIPVFEEFDGNSRFAWYKNGELHRESGPAVIYPNGSQYWYKNGELHRESGPAIIWPNGYQAWYKNGQLHREDGPAMIFSDGTQEWYKNGVRQK